MFWFASRHLMLALWSASEDPLYAHIIVSFFTLAKSSCSYSYFTVPINPSFLRSTYSFSFLLRLMFISYSHTMLYTSLCLTRVLIPISFILSRHQHISLPIKSVLPFLLLTCIIHHFTFMQKFLKVLALLGRELEAIRFHS